MNDTLSIPAPSHLVRPRALRVKHAAAYSGLSVTSIWKLLREDEDFQRLVKPFKVGSATLFLVEELDEFLKLRASKGASLQTARMARTRAYRVKHEGEFDTAKATSGGAAPEPKKTPA